MKGQNGKKAEDEFYKRCIGLGRDVKVSTQFEDMFKHIDFYVNGVSYDVKSEKKIDARDEKSNPDCIWLEMKNVRGDKGWLCSEVQKIAFQRNDNFYVVDREKLLQFTREFIGYGNPQYKKEYKKLHTRRYLKDLTAYVWWSDIEHLLEEII